MSDCPMVSEGTWTSEWPGHLLIYVLSALSHYLSTVVQHPLAIIASGIYFFKGCRVIWHLAIPLLFITKKLPVKKSFPSTTRAIHL